MNRATSVLEKRATLAACLGLLAFLAIWAVLLMCAPGALAKSATVKSIWYADPQGEEIGYEGTPSSLLKGAKKVSAKSSNTRVVDHVKAKKVSKGPDKGNWNVCYDTMGRAGKATITVKGVKKGKKVTVKLEIKVLKYKNPVSFFGLGILMMHNAFKKSTRYDMASLHNEWLSSDDYTGKQKVIVLAKKGWSLESIYLYSYKTGKRRTIKNGSTVSLPKTGYDLTASFKNKSNKAYQDATVSFDPDEAYEE